jgi:Sulfotransferase family
MNAPGRDLDFIVIGVQKGATTSLWQYLRRHPQIAMPDFKEAPVFCMDSERIPTTLARLMDSAFGEVGPQVKLGKVTPHYMMGKKDVDVDLIAERIAAALPDVRLIALLRDPIERAISQYRMSVRRGYESRSFDVAVAELLQPDQLELGRTRPTETNSYLAQGEYGRILQSYRARFPAERLHVELTEALDTDPGATIDRILSYLGLPAGYRPEGLDVRHYPSGAGKRLDADAEAQLRTFMGEQIWPHLGGGRQRAKLAFEFFVETWNVIPDDRPPALSPTNRARLEAHYASDDELLAGLGIEAPWLAAWAER